METYLGSPQLARKIEVRASESVHDRVVLADSGEAFTLGLSLNGVGQRSTTVLTPLPAPAVSALLREYQAIWREAAWISPAEPEQDQDADEPVSPGRDEQSHETGPDPDATDDRAERADKAGKPSD